MRKTAALAAFGTLLTAGPFLGAATTAQADDPAAPAPATPVTVSVQTAAGTKSVSATGTVADALAAAGVVADANDKVSQPLSSSLVEGMAIKFNRIDTKYAYGYAGIRFATQTRYVKTLPKGSVRVIVKGKNGISVEQRLLTYTDGKLTGNVRLRVYVGKKPVTQVRQVGTKAAAGRVIGTCSASYYDEPQMTASGERFNPNALTAAHKTLRLGTRILVTNPRNGKSVIVRINDRGPYVGGRCLDLSRASFARIANLGAGVTRVTIRVL